MPSRLNTTDFAILGLLARRPWSAYEMTQYMRTSNVRAIWPRAESRIYESPKKLAKLGFATTSTESQGKRSRTVYAITANGKQALSEWLLEEGKGFSFEYEALLKLDLSDIGNKEVQEALLERLMAQGHTDWEQLREFFELFASGDRGEVSVDRRAQNLLINGFIMELLAARQRWSKYAGSFQQEFNQCQSEAEKEVLISRSYAALLQRQEGNLG